MSIQRGCSLCAALVAGCWVLGFYDSVMWWYPKVAAALGHCLILLAFIRGAGGLFLDLSNPEDLIFQEDLLWSLWSLLNHSIVHITLELCP